ncbi:Stp1/IreP family PP2C-type Ser/Thr phosphatase [Variovorax sp. HJSM1_2]|uniref:Stp1/IreP family PP2C-type Ser/Thr phosphatase n=1 Tax=Variovorax sp. HJSM1_2 TaxID=3366263 RepID=UPI003BCE3A1A
MYEFSSQTHPGLLRENNEDAAAFDEACGVAVLADGMGGYNAGEVASDMTVQSIKSDLCRWMTEYGDAATVKAVRQAVSESVALANSAVFHASNANSQYAGMGTTLVMGVFLLDQVVVGHIGDSRCYRLRDRQLVQISKDHSFLQEQIDAGLITPEQAAVSSNRNLVTRALGIDDEVQLEVHEHRVEAGDLYLFCSDGLTDMVPDSPIAKILETDASLEQKAKQLINAANAHGGRDNITVLLVHAVSDQRKRGLMARLIGN